MITVFINGKKRELEDGTTVESLLQLLDVSRGHLAVERNRSIVPRTQFDETILADGDQIEIVSLVGGG